MERLQKFKIGALQVQEALRMCYGMAVQRIFTGLDSKEWLVIFHAFLIKTYNYSCLYACILIVFSYFSDIMRKR